MVGIVLVSHSAELAAAVKALAEQQTQGQAAIAAVGGTSDPDHPFGTDAMAIAEAIQAVYSDAGVLVLMDLGSALMSTEMAIEFLDLDQQPHVRMSQAPFVEGAMAAAVQASIGMDLDAVAREAIDALGPKAESLGVAAPGSTGEPAPAPAGQTGAGSRPAATEPSPADAAGGGEHTATVTLVNAAGLHFGPAVQFVQTAARYPATITVRNVTTGAGPVDARRFNQVMALGAELGHQVEIRTLGDRAPEALAALVTLAKEGFGEGIAGQAAQAATAAPAQGTGLPEVSGRGRAILRGIPASPGAAVGQAWPLGGTAGPAAQRTQRAERVAAQTSELAPDAEWDRYVAASEQAKAELRSLAQRLSRELGPEQGRIFEAHSLLLDDLDWQDAVGTQLREHGLTAESAVSAAAEALAGQYEAMTGARFRERATDVRDVGARVVRLLAGPEAATELVPNDGNQGGAPSGQPLPEAAVIVAEDLAPSQTASLDRSRVMAFCTALGGPTAHTAILARSLGIPAVVGLGADAYAQIPAGALLAIDGTAGAVIVEPDGDTVAAYRARQAAEAASRATAWAGAQGLAHTADGQRVEVVANLATAADAVAALQAGAEGVGLLRTEFLFQDRNEPPTEEEQYAVYREVAERMAPRPVIIRTLDIGGDKPAPYLRLPAEMNPFLGWRAIRVCLAMPDFFKVQLRAILRAAAAGNVLVMFPMIAVRAEVEQARGLLREAERELAAANVPHAAQVPTGIMVEVPAAAETPDLLAPVVDFFSIGTNDLTQYTFAADRGNARVAGIGDPLHPAVLRQISRIIEAAHAAGKWVGLCGELAGQPAAIPVLLGLGLDEFSMAAASIPEAKKTLAKLTVPDAQALARRALGLPDAAAVRSAVRELDH